MAIEGVAKYVFDDGNVYEGEVKDGEFHGAGKLTFANGMTYIGRWEHGHAVDGKLVFADGLEFAPNMDEWDYCSSKDRRYYLERVNGIQPADGTQVTAHVPRQPIPPGTYDVVHGYFSPDDGWVYSYDGKQLRRPEPEECAWIVKTCFKA
ncbi:MORN repeat-containing protein 5 [Allomyces arbusculus]|nr:MORN repeat-containing protein 5 [Allomyces arbusculus]